MTPTAELRFVERQIQHTFATTITIRVLQQKFVEYATQGDDPDLVEWHDVPLVKEAA